MSYAYVDYKDEDDIYATYSQKELDVREEYLKMIEGNSTELIYEPKDFRETNPDVLKSVIGTTSSSFKEAFITYIKRMGEIFFTVDPYDLIPLAVDLMDHYMNIHKEESLPFDATSGRSSTNYMNAIRADPNVQPILMSESDDNSSGSESSCSPTSVSAFYDRVHSHVTKKKLGLSRIYEVDAATERYLKPGFNQKAPWNEDYDPDEGYEEVTFRICANAEGQAFAPFAHQDYDLNAETFLNFLVEFQKHTSSSQLKPVLLLVSRKIKIISLDVIYFCEQNGIILCTFPAFSRNLDPLARRSMPMIRKKFNETLASKGSDDSLATSEGVAELVKSIAINVQQENVARVKRDFCECLRLSSCMKLRCDVPEDGVGLELNSEASASQASCSSQAYSSEPHQPKKKRTAARANEGLNELMFAQVGPLRESDFYY